MKAAAAALLAVTLVTMLVLEWRLIGVLAMFGFIVAGVFAIARPEFLDPDPEEPGGAGGS